MPNRDRVADVYHGRAQSREAQEACRERIHWMCRHAAGLRVLDIGCSQGIAALILAREGRRVLGIDIEPEPLEDARRALAAEPASVQERVEFRVADAFALELEPGSFDVALLGEVLEHLTSPAELLARVHGWLAPGGRVVVSVPLGYHPFPDHKQTFHVFGLLALLNERFEVQDIEVVHDRYLCAVATRSETVPAPQPAIGRLFEWAARCEAALERRERRADAERHRLRAEHQRLTAALQDARTRHAAQVRALRHRMALRLRGLRRELAAARQRLCEAEAARQEQLAALRAELAARDEHAAALTQQLAQQAAQTDALRDECRRLGQQLAQQRREAARQVRELRAARDQERTRHREAQQRISQLREQIAYLRDALRLRDEEVRYQLGDALVRAVDSPADLLRLPVRLVRLFVRGLARRRARRRAAAAPQTVVQPVASAAPPGGGNGSAAAAAGAPVARPRAADPRYAPAPRKQVARPELVVAAVMDEFSWNSWKYEAQFHALTPEDWRSVLEEHPPALLLVESTWKGPHNAWDFQVRDLGRRPDRVARYVLPEIVAWCRRRDIPTVFYSKEDPPNFEHFIDAARLFDYVFTSDADCIELYRARLGHERIGALPFAAQPRIHNPVLEGEGRCHPVAFAGTWYNHRHPQRQQEAERILAPALEFGLHIYDRMADSGLPAYRWPECYQPALRGAVPYAEMLRVYKQYKVFLNINTVCSSPTMFARRVFELLACGTPVVSSYSLGIERLLGADVVLMSRDAGTTRALLERLLSDEPYRERLALLGQRRVFSAHTYGHRFREILARIGLPAGSGAPRLEMVAVAGDEQELEAICANYLRQEYPHKGLRLGVLRSALAGRAAQRLGNHPGARIEPLGDQNIVAWLARAAGAAGADYVLPMHPRDYYGPWYLTDCAHATAYVDGEPVGKGTWYACDAGGVPQVVSPGHEYRRNVHLHPWTLCVPAAALRNVLSGGLRADSPETFWQTVAETLGPGYSADRFNYVAGAHVGARAATSSADASRPAELQAAVV